MKIKKLNESGVAALAVVLIIVIVAAVAGTGYYVYNAKKNTDKTLSDSAKGAGDAQKAEKKKKEAAKPAPAPDPTADWLTYSNKTGSYSFKYPKSWVQADHPDLCNPGSALFGTNAASVGKCASESFGQMSFSGSKGDDRTDVEMNSASYPGFQTEAVTINGVTGKKQTGNFQAVPDAVGGPKTGDKFVTYTFYANGYTYSARYAVNSAYPDALADFNTLVTKTFKFTP